VAARFFLDVNAEHPKSILALARIADAGWIPAFARS
jgi:hypothetical protein